MITGPTNGVFAAPHVQTSVGALASVGRIGSAHAISGTVLVRLALVRICALVIGIANETLTTRALGPMVSGRADRVLTAEKVLARIFT